MMTVLLLVEETLGTPQCLGATEKPTRETQSSAANLQLPRAAGKRWGGRQEAASGAVGSKGEAGGVAQGQESLL